MAATETNTESQPRLSNVPVDVDKHQANLEKRREAQQKKRPKLLKCLDPLTAAAYEAKKPTFEWEIKVDLFRPASAKERAKTHKFCEQVVAQNADDAWAMFCDKIGEWPSRRDSNPSITKLKQRTADNDD